MAKKKPKFPEAVYISWRGDEDDPYLSAEQKPEDVIDDAGETKIAAIYRLERVVTVENKTLVREDI